MHNQPYAGRIALGTRNKLLKSGEIRHFYGTYTVHFTLYTLHCTVYILHCTLYIVQCTMYTVHSTEYTKFSAARYFYLKFITMRYIPTLCLEILNTVQNTI